MMRRYKIFDVFTERPLAGNPVALVLDAERLDDRAMQGIAREFNLSETVFVLPPEGKANNARIRIFTPKAEIDFAGHPTVGTAVCLARERFAGANEGNVVLILEENVGAVRCGVSLGERGGFAEFDCPKLPEKIAEARPQSAIAAALGLEIADLGFENYVPSVWSCGNPFDLIPLRNMGALARATCNRGAWEKAFVTGSAFLYTHETEGHDHTFRARMYAPTFGIEEDPATGSAVAALAGALHEFDAPPDGDRTTIVEQGYEMGRRSLIRMTTSVMSGALTSVRIGGNAVEVASGELAL
jgi:trans-2,3-dihydro-3-hydroxyanthranilate isomerase